MKTLITTSKLCALSALLLFGSLSYAEDTLSVICDTDVDGTATNCHIDQGGIPLSENLLEFTKEIANLATDPATTSCTNPVTGTYECNLGGAINVSCATSQDSASCNILASDGSDLDIFSLGCTNDLSLRQKTCQLTSSPENLTEKLKEEGVIPDDPNFEAVSTAFLSCLNMATYGSLSQICNQIISDVQGGDYQAAAAALAQLRPIDPEIAAEMANMGLNQLIGTVFSRLNRLRSGGFEGDNDDSAQYFHQNQWLDSGALLAQDSSIQSDATPNDVTVNMSEYGKLGFFVNASVTDAEYTKQSSTDDITASALTLGIDYRFSTNTVGGVAFNITQQNTDFDVSNSATSGEIDAEGFSAIAYGSYYLDSWYFDGALTLGGSNIDQERSPTSGDQYETSYTAGYHALSLATGYDFNIASFNITPYIQYDIGSIDIDDYREKTKSGDPSAAIEVKEQTRDIGALSVGSYFRYIINTEKGVFIPEASLRLVKDSETDSQVITGRFIANTAPGSEFEITSTELDDSYAVIGLGFSFQLKSGNSGFINIESVEAYDGLDQNRFTAGWRWEIH